ncbi:MAG: hypothetical protein ABFD50_10480 [Smithella sp.]
MLLKECIVCGKTFETGDKRKLICSQECVKAKKNQYVRDKKTEEIEQKRLEKTCSHCGKTFIPEGRRNITKARFCSAKCRQNFKNKERWEKIKPPDPEPRACVICGKSFTPSRRTPNAVTCSSECNIKRQQAKDKEMRDGQRNEKLRQGKDCPVCGIRFFPKTLSQKFCSEKCRLEKKKEVQRKNAATIPSEVKSARSKKCRWSGNWLKSIERDEYKCQLCGSMDGVVVHHLNGRGERRKNGKRIANRCDSLDNLVSLCTQCHRDIHGVFLILQDGEWVVYSPLFEELDIGDSIKTIKSLDDEQKN